MKFDDFLSTHLGEMGKYQKIQFFLVCLPTIIVPMHVLSWTFASVEPPFRCKLAFDKNEEFVTSKLNFTKCVDSSETEVSMTDYGKKPGVICQYAEKCEGPDGICSEHVFDHSLLKYTATERWDLTCDRKWIKATIQAAYYVGQMGGSMTFGVLGDRIGRKKVFVVAIIIQIICAYLIAIAPFWWAYAIVRAGLGFAHPGIFAIAVVIGMELVGPKNRKLASVITALCSAVGQVLLATEAIFFTDYRILHVVIATPSLLFLSYWWLVPESIRWLVSQKRFKEADKVLQKAAKVNGVTLPDQWWEQLDDAQTSSTEDQTDQQPKKALTGGDLFKTPELRRRTLIAFYLWPVVSMVYYGMAMKANILGGDIYINSIFAALVEIPALFVVYLLIDRIGRRLILASGYFIAGICLILNWVMGNNTPLVISIGQMMLTRGAITAVYAVMYTYAPELFPTTIRNTAMGFCLTVARVGAISASYISMYIAERFGKLFMIIPFGTLAVIAALLTLFFLPETMGKPLPETVEEIEADDLLETEQERQPLSDSSEETV